MSFYADNVLTLGSNVPPRTLKADTFLLWQKLAVARAASRVLTGQKTDQTNKETLALRGFEINCELIIRDYSKCIPHHPLIQLDSQQVSRLDSLQPNPQLIQRPRILKLITA